MQRNGLWLKIMPSGEEVECNEHSFSWSGKIPGTGVLRCSHCACPSDETTSKGETGAGLTPIRKITIIRLEGPKNLCDVEQETCSFEEAENTLRKNAWSCRSTGGYDKHQVVFEWSDGTTYSCRIDVSHPERGGVEATPTECLEFISKWRDDDFSTLLRSKLAMAD